MQYKISDRRKGRLKAVYLQFLIYTGSPPLMYQLLNGYIQHKKSVYWQCCSLVSGKCPAILHTSQLFIHVHFSDLEIIVQRTLMCCLTFYFPPLSIESFSEKHILKKNIRFLAKKKYSQCFEYTHLLHSVMYFIGRQFMGP